MPNLSVRGLDTATLARIRSIARRRRVSVNRVIVDTLREQYAAQAPEFRDLDALAGTWSKAEADEFAAAIAPFGEVDPELWVAEPKGAYRVKRKGKPRTRR
jgi:hypothetical protein